MTNTGLNSGEIEVAWKIHIKVWLSLVSEMVDYAM